MSRKKAESGGRKRGFQNSHLDFMTFPYYCLYLAPWFINWNFLPMHGSLPFSMSPNSKRWLVTIRLLLLYLLNWLLKNQFLFFQRKYWIAGCWTAMGLLLNNYWLNGKAILLMKQPGLMNVIFVANFLTSALRTRLFLMWVVLIRACKEEKRARRGRIQKKHTWKVYSRSSNMK